MHQAIINIGRVSETQLLCMIVCSTTGMAHLKSYASSEIMCFHDRPICVSSNKT